MEKNLEEVKANTTSEKNSDLIDKVLKGIEKLTELVTTLIPVPTEEKDKTPNSPEVKLEGIKFVAVRKPGGRIVRRPVREEKKEETKPV